MNPFSDVTQLPDDFDGQVRLFPLPGLVLFPHAMQPLHVFEPRYVEMLREALATDQLITMATLLDPYAVPVTSPPAVAKTVCIGKIVSHAELAGDRHNILLVGVRRAKIRRELETTRPFRSAQVDLIDDFYVPAATAQRNELKRRLLTSFGKIIPPKAGSQKSLHDLMAGQMGVGPITDIIAYTLPFEPEDKLKLLEMSDVDARAEHLIRLIDRGDIDLQSVSSGEKAMESHENPQRPLDNRFPPPFSVN
ncbi:LON peptidase substrate-binding domain-containing protein [Aporhodopirellula aestuarii]|uniref:LON peptidase substrate-binding domain-containing protein n=1 Tax=Aporhodopirellula aestuarii TaxID=2950107 RepID=A0ABT0U5R4_9BACT|nr:LON peptidase substrate-binding domain-containing protein [Aporhodopirellula aestuarii]MCM2372260.1 LON peptidase substrate-binding domain-containing protein [Aporhodopirellula aestuarii]